ncbi:heme o synthase [Pantoea sp. Aalb]|uniref:heme o synthase n=1 Tax=Pantoea sp. Aalb TaxID=2576762 RepID=UPI001324B81E|nr:heme o synthase [Pantoea sp. Aalb]MXP67580.1 protoheme IX farnesyltransferase [Pantoea sp. Aalb]
MNKQCLQVTKPGIIFANLISLIGGFLLAAKGNINYFLLFSSLVGMSLVIASSCIFNNVIDRDIDMKMTRTKNRVLVKGLISKKLSLIYATILGLTGLILIYIEVNILSMWLAIIGFVVYVVIYSLYMKRKSIYGTLVGSIAGATPPVIGYCAVTNKFNDGAFILLTIFSLWQIPHSYAISIFCLKDYEAANIPVLPLIKGIRIAKIHIILYILAFMISTFMLSFNGYTGYNYLIIATVLSIWWLRMAFLGKKTSNNTIWARKIFIFSIITIISLSVMMSIDFVTPMSKKVLTNI